MAWSKGLEASTAGASSRIPNSVLGPLSGLEGESPLTTATEGDLIARTVRQMTWAFLVAPHLADTLLEDIEQNLGQAPTPSLAEIYRLLAEWRAEQDDTVLEYGSLFNQEEE